MAQFTHSLCEEVIRTKGRCGLTINEKVQMAVLALRALGRPEDATGAASAPSSIAATDYHAIAEEAISRIADYHEATTEALLIIDVRQAIEKAVATALSATLPQQQWISCDQKLPVGITKGLLLYGEHEMLIIGVFNTPESVFLGWDDEAQEWRTFANRVTHWMEIPPTPSGTAPDLGLRVEAT